MLLTFLIVFFLLKHLAWKPILNMLREREDSISKALVNARNAQEALDKLSQENERMMAEARRQKEQILKEARELKEQILSESREQAREEKASIIEDARKVILKERADALQDIRNIAAEYSVSIASRLLRRELQSDEAQKKLIEDSLSDIHKS